MTSKPVEQVVETRKSTIEEEIEAISESLQRISALDVDAQGRVMRYLKDRLGVYLGTD